MYRKSSLNRNADALSRWPGIDKIPDDHDEYSEIEDPPLPIINSVGVHISTARNRTRLTISNATPQVESEWQFLD